MRVGVVVDEPEFRGVRYLEVEVDTPPLFCDEGNPNVHATVIQVNVLDVVTNGRSERLNARRIHVVDGL